MTALLITDDHPAYITGLKTIFKQYDPTLAIYEAQHLEATKNCLRFHPEIKVLLLDRTLPGVDALHHVQDLWAINPTLKICIISANNADLYVQEASEARVQGFISKSMDTDYLIKAFDTILKNERYFPSNSLTKVSELTTTDLFSPQQGRILPLMSLGLTNKQIGRELGLEEGTIKQHVYSICRKLQVKNRVQAVQVARMRGFIC